MSPTKIPRQSFMKIPDFEPLYVESSSYIKERPDSKKAIATLQPLAWRKLITLGRLPRSLRRGRRQTDVNMKFNVVESWGNGKGFWLGCNFGQRYINQNRRSDPWSRTQQRIRQTNSNPIHHPRVSGLKYIERWEILARVGKFFFHFSPHAATCYIVNA